MYPKRISWTRLNLIVATVSVTVGGCPPEISPIDGSIGRDAPPVIATCPEDRTISAGANCQSELPDLTPGVEATDDQDNLLTVSQSPAPGTLIGVGETLVNLTVVDSVGNETTCTMTVTVEDDAPPTFDDLGGLWGVPATSGGSGAVPDFAAVVLGAAADNCDDDLDFSQDPAAGTLLPVGNHDIAVVLTDDAGNSYRGTIQLEVFSGGVPEGFQPATILHRGSDMLAAGPNVDSSVGLTTPAGYTPFGRIGLSGDGQKAWFVLFDEFPDVPGDPQTQLWSVNTDGTGGARSGLPAGDFHRGLAVVTNYDGSVAISTSTQDGELMRSTPGLPARVQFTTLDHFPDTCLWGQMGLSDNATRLVYLSPCDDTVYQVDLTADPVVPRILALGASFAIDGSTDHLELANEFDMASTAAQWMAQPSVYDGSIGQRRQAVSVGTGLSSPTIVHQSLPSDVRIPSHLNMSDDGSKIAYVLSAVYHGARAAGYVQSVGSSTRIEIVDADADTNIGDLVMSDDGTRVYARTDAGHDRGYGFLEDLANGERRLCGSGHFADAGPRFTDVTMSDDGSVLAAAVSRGVYILHDGVDGLAGFPSIDSIAYRYNGGECTLTVRVEVTAPGGVETVYVRPLFHGLEPTRALPEAQNPFMYDRFGSTLEEIQAGVWQYDMVLSGGGDCRQSLIDGEFNLRVVLVAANGSRAVFQDFAPLP